MKTNFKVYVNVSEFNKYKDNSFFVEINRFLNSKLIYDLFSEYYAQSFSEGKEYTNDIVNQNGLYIINCTYDLKNHSIDIKDGLLCE